MSDEDEDAQPLGDEFAVMLSRRNTNQGPTEDQSSGKRTPNGKRPGGSRQSTRTVSSKSVRSPSDKTSQRSASSKSLVPFPALAVEEQPEPPSITDLQREEERIAQEEELEVNQKREAAQRLALERGLSLSEVKSLANIEAKPEHPKEEESNEAVEITTPERDLPQSAVPKATKDAEQPEPTSSSRDDVREGKDPT